MPTYEYECRSCGHRFERFQSMKEKPVTKCPLCAGKVDRLIGAGAGVIFRGSGFYSTDYRSESYRKAKQKEKSSSSESGSKKEAGGGSGEKGSARAGDKKTDDRKKNAKAMTTSN